MVTTDRDLATRRTVSALTPTWGTASDRWHAVTALLLSALVSAGYVAGTAWLDVATPTRLEVVGTWTSLASVLLCRRQNPLAMPIGIASVVVMGVFFARVDLVGQAWLHLAYYVPVQVLGWRVWLRGGVDGGEAPVRRAGAVGLAVAAAATVAGTAALVAIFAALHGETPYLPWDASIAAASVVAQTLMTVKRIESWWWWVGPVDVSAVALYAVTDAWMFAALYLLYVVVASTGWQEWRKALARQAAGASPARARRSG